MEDRRILKSSHENILVLSPLIMDGLKPVQGWQVDIISCDAIVNI